MAGLRIGRSENFGLQLDCVAIAVAPGAVKGMARLLQDGIRLLGKVAAIVNIVEE